MALAATTHYIRKYIVQFQQTIIRATTMLPRAVTINLDFAAFDVFTPSFVTMAVALNSDALNKLIKPMNQTFLKIYI